MSEMTAVETIRAAAARLRCDHSWQAESEDKSPCRQCGMPWDGRDIVAPAMRAPLADWLVSAADEHVTQEWTDCPSADAALPVARLILGVKEQGAASDG